MGMTGGGAGQGRGAAGRRLAGTDLAVFLVALAVRAVYFWQIRDAAAFSLILGDAEGYDTWARGIASGDWLGSRVFYQAPLYPYFLGALYRLFGPSALLARLVQWLIGSVACVLLARAGRRFFDARTGALAGLLLALYPTAIFSEGLVQKSALDLLFMTLLLALLGRLAQGARDAWWLATGAALGGFALTRENTLALAAVTLLWLLFFPRKQPRAVALRRAGALLLGLAVVLLPVGLRNLRVGGEFHLTTSQFGPNFYIGNNPEADGRYAPLAPGGGSVMQESVDATRLAEQATGRRLGPGEVSSFWAREAFTFIKAEPGAWLRLMARKGLLVWNRLELPDTDDQYSYGDWAPLLGLLNRVLHFGLLVPLAGAGIALTWRARRRLRVLHAILAAYAASVALFYVFSRYRYPLVPLLLLFAAAALVRLPRELRRRRFRRLTTPLGIAAALAVLANWPLLPGQEAIGRAMMRNNIGVGEWTRDHAADEALRSFAEASRIDPGYAEPHRNAGMVLRKTGRFREAAASYRRALALLPADPGLATQLGFCLNDLGRAAEAEPLFLRALRLDPALAAAHYGLAIALTKLWRAGEAERHFAEAARLDPRYARTGPVPVRP
jgi:4-amino-4-deoxy-L-arabinose transferase-like glycosyltransferase